jgi:hypothetical protein
MNKEKGEKIMYINVKQLAEKINNCERFKPEEIKKDPFIIEKVYCYPLAASYTKGYNNYIIQFTSGKKEYYTRDSVPVSVIEWINKAMFFNVITDNETGEKQTVFFN